VPVVIHDDTVDRTTSLAGPVAGHAAAALKEAGVPCLAEVAEAVRGRAVLIVEIKGGEGVVEAVVQVLREQKMLAQTILFGFDPEHLALAKRLEPKIPTVLLVGLELPTPKAPDLLRRMEECGADGLGMHYFGILPEIAKPLRSRQVPLFAWTVPPGPGVDRLLDLGVNFLVTDHPREVLTHLQGLLA
jgi:glycerophosphoryl diester phosphodiesterase